MIFSQLLNSHRIFKRIAKALIRLCICAGWSELLLVAHTTLLEISCHGSSLKSAKDVIGAYRVKILTLNYILMKKIGVVLNLDLEFNVFWSVPIIPSCMSI